MTGSKDAIVRCLWLWVAVLLVWGCTGSSGQGSGALPSQAMPTGSGAEPEPNQAAGSSVDLRELSGIALIEGPAAQELAVSRLLREFGVVHLVESYLINIPPAAEFLFNFEVFVTGSANRHFYASADGAGAANSSFERRMRQSARAARESLPDATRPSVLDDAFFEVLEQCGRASAWPHVELFVRNDDRGFPPVPLDHIEPEYGISQFEYLQLRHQCARYAATYPTLDPAVRDELLAPQRAHYARVILDRLDNELPLVEVPHEYQDEIDDLRANGW